MKKILLFLGVALGPLGLSPLGLSAAREAFSEQNSQPLKQSLHYRGSKNDCYALLPVPKISSQLKQAVYKMQERYGIEAIAIGNGMMIQDPTLDICLKFVAWRKEEMEEARSWLRSLGEYCRYIAKLQPKQGGKKTTIGYKMLFWDKSYNRSCEPFLAEVYFDGSKLSFYGTKGIYEPPRLLMSEPLDGENLNTTAKPT